MYGRAIDPLNRAHCLRVLAAVAAFGLVLVLLNTASAALAGAVLLTVVALACWAAARTIARPRDAGHPSSVLRALSSASSRTSTGSARPR
jgi:hypothetical protein